MKTIHDLLYQWGRSRRSGDGAGLYYKSVSPYAREMRNSGQYAAKAPALDDDWHCHVDHHVSRLKTKPGKMHEIICLYYVEKQTTAEIAREIRRSSQYVNTQRKAAEHYLEAKLEDCFAIG